MKKKSGNFLRESRACRGWKFGTNKVYIEKKSRNFKKATIFTYIQNKYIILTKKVVT